MTSVTRQSLPTLSPGINLLQADDQRTEALHALAVNQLILFGGKAVWLDGANRIDPSVLHRLAPSPGLLERITVARAFTAEQHFSLLDDLAAIAERDTGLVVLPGVDHLYREDDLLGGEGDRMLEQVLAKVAREAERYDVPVLLTADWRSSRVEDAVDETVTCRRTRQGITFEADSFRTLTYSGPGYIQTTLLFWEQVLEATYERVEREEQVVEVAAGGAQ